MKPFNRRKRKMRLKRQDRPVPEAERGENDPPRPEYQWLNSQAPANGGVPGSLKGMSEHEEEYIAKTLRWIKNNCNFS
jgi:hypothetical protein